MQLVPRLDNPGSSDDEAVKIAVTRGVKPV
jgi:hypothetical protein